MRNRKIFKTTMRFICLVLLLIVRHKISKPIDWKSVPLKGGVSLGYYTIDMELGFPLGKKQTLIVDTGSRGLTVPCKGCKSCNDGHVNGLYNPYKSDSCVGIGASNVFLSWVCQNKKKHERYVF